MFDFHSEIHGFYSDHVRLKREDRKLLGEYRDTNIERLKAGLSQLEYPHPAKVRTQGSCAMATVNQHPDNEYDIDVALIFESDDLPASPYDARKRIEEAMQEGGGNFSKPPEARTNAVTVWYQEGHHVDLAIHRIAKDPFGNEIIEHAGVTWSYRDPIAITNWFIDMVETLSPSKDYGATVDRGQLRRIVQLLKMFGKSRTSSSWNLPGGLIISALVSECYQCDYHRDDKALYKTMYAIESRLRSNIEVSNPVDTTQYLTYKDEYRNQVCRFQNKLEKALEWLDPLFENDCDRLTAARAWRDVFKHQYWRDLVTLEEAKQTGEAHRAAIKAGGAYVTTKGHVLPEKPHERSTQIPPHRNYGDD